MDNNINDVFIPETEEESVKQFRLKPLKYFLTFTVISILIFMEIFLLISIFKSLVNSQDVQKLIIFIFNFLLFGAFLIYILFKFFKFMGLYVIISEEGVSYNKNKNTAFISWDEIKDVFFGLKKNRQNQLYVTYCAIRLGNNSRYVFPSFLKQVNILAKKILIKTYSRLHGKLFDNFKQGLEIDFNAFQLVITGLKIGSETLNKDEIEDIELEDRSFGNLSKGGSHYILNIKKRAEVSSWISIPIYEISNLIFFIFIVNYWLKGYPSTEINCIKQVEAGTRKKEMIISFKFADKIFDFAEIDLSADERRALEEEPISKKRRVMLWMDPKLIFSASAIYDPFGRESYAIEIEDVEWFRKVDALAEKASLSVKNGDFNEAVKFYLSALKTAPGGDLFLMSIGECFSKIREIKKAFLFLERANEINPNSERIKQNLYAVRKLLQ